MERERLDLTTAAEHLLEECRMVLPGIQALFGFQLVAVFDDRFGTNLDAALQTLHFVALVLVAVAVGLVMAPAAYHRQTGTRQVTEHFVHLASRLLLFGMIPLAVGICLDVYVIAHMVLHSTAWAAGASVLLLAIFAFLWLILPRAAGDRERSA